MAANTIVSVGDTVTYYEAGVVVNVPFNFFLPTASTTTANALQTVDPAVITLTAIDPTGATTNPAAIKDAAGQYHVNITASKVGLWRLSGVTTTPVSAFSYLFSVVPQRTS